MSNGSKKTRTANNKSTAEKAEKIARSTGPMAPAVRMLSEPLTHQDEATLGYLLTLTNPVHVKHPVAPPLLLGASAIETLKVEMHMAATIICNASGFGFAQLIDDCWAENETGNYFNTIVAYNGNGGVPLGYSTAAYATTTGPTAGATPGVGGTSGYTMPQLDGATDVRTRIRLIAFGLETYPVDTNDNTSGQIYVCSTTDPYNLSNGMYAATESSLEAANPLVTTVKKAALANWPAGKTLSTFAVPTDSSAFDMWGRPATGSGTLQTNFGYPTLGVYVYGAQSSQKVFVRANYIFEFEKPNDNRVGEDSEFAPTQPASEISDQIRLAHLFNNEGPLKPHASSGLHNGAGVKAFTQHLMNTRPYKIPSLAAEIKKPSANWGSAALAGLNFAADKVIGFLPKKLAGPATFIKNWLFD